MKPPHVEVTDHALVRWLERVKGIDLSDLRKEIARTVTPAVVLGAKAMSSDGFTYYLDGNRVTTVTPGKSPQSARHGAAIHNGRGVRRLQRPEGKR